MTTKTYLTLLKSKSSKEESSRINSALSYKEAVKSEMARILLKKQLSQIRAYLADRFYEMSEEIPS